jgi:hypothetical protein
VTEQLFPFANIVTGILVLIVGFGLHWVGQLISWVNWDLSVKLGIANKDTIPEHRDYEQGMAAADSLLAWVYGIAAIGILFNISWAYKLLWFPGVVLIYHALGFWFWTRYQIKAGRPMYSTTFAIVWCSVNIVTGALAILLAWRA